MKRLIFFIASILLTVLAVFVFLPKGETLAAGPAPRNPGVILLNPITPNPADNSITVSGTINGGAVLNYGYICTDGGISYTTAPNIASANGWSINGTSLSGNYSLTQTTIGSEGSFDCITKILIDSPAAENQYSFSFTVNVGQIPNGVYTITVNALTYQNISASGAFTVQHAAPVPVLNADLSSVYADGIQKDTLHVSNAAPNSPIELHYTSPVGVSGVAYDFQNSLSNGTKDNLFGSWDNSSAGTWRFYVTVAGQNSNTITITFTPVTTMTLDLFQFYFTKGVNDQYPQTDTVQNSPSVGVPSYARTLGAYFNFNCTSGYFWLSQAKTNCNNSGARTLYAGTAAGIGDQRSYDVVVDASSITTTTRGNVYITGSGLFSFLDNYLPSSKWWAFVKPVNAFSSTSTQIVGVTVIVPAPAPTCSASPGSITTGQSTALSATRGDGANYSWNTGGGSPASGSGASLSVSYATAGTKTVSVTSSGQSGTCSVIVTAPTPTPIPSADIKANGSDGPISIAYNTSVTLSWTSTNAASCSVTPGGWTGTSNPGVSTGNLTSSTTYSLNCSGPGGSAADNVTVNVNPPPNNPPTVSAVTYTEPNYCTSGPDVSIRWTYADIDGDAQASYQVQVAANGSAWSVMTADSGVISSSNNAWSVGPGSLLFNTTYKARVRVTDARGATSSWVETSLPSNTWKTPLHAYPWIPFPLSYTPSSPRKNLPTQFTDSSTCYDNNNNPTACASWLWNFGDAGTSNLQSPSHTYSSIGSFNSTQTVTDKSGNTCTSSPPTVINILQPNPQWKEVSPK